MAKRGGKTCWVILSIIGACACKGLIYSSGAGGYLTTRGGRNTIVIDRDPRWSIAYRAAGGRYPHSRGRYALVDTDSGERLALDFQENELRLLEKSDSESQQFTVEALGYMHQGKVQRIRIRHERNCLTYNSGRGKIGSEPCKRMKENKNQVFEWVKVRGETPRERIRRENRGRAADRVEQMGRSRRQGQTGGGDTDPNESSGEPNPWQGQGQGQKESYYDNSDKVYNHFPRLRNADYDQMKKERDGGPSKPEYDPSVYHPRYIGYG
jgi:hypothetical protein